MFGFRLPAIVCTLLLAVISAHAQQHDMQWIQRGNASSAIGIRFSADGSTFITIGYQSEIRRWETATGNLLSAIPYPSANGGYWQSVAYSAGGNYIVTTSSYPGPRLRLYDARTSEMLGGSGCWG